MIVHDCVKGERESNACSVGRVSPGPLSTEAASHPPVSDAAAAVAGDAASHKTCFSHPHHLNGSYSSPFTDGWGPKFAI